ncbi:heme NO-binding domain-containing protein [bacterium]|nr:heme NO-binding domain-containing protein [candidate division CSSED10-310 bacterium]
MKGIINKGIKDFIEYQFGSENWNRVRLQAQCPSILFSVAEDYPDKLTEDLFVAAVIILNRPVDDLMSDFGKFWVSNTGRRAYPTLFEIAGRNSRSFLKNMDKIHRIATRNIPNAHPPELKCTDLQNGNLLMHYKSPRKLCSVLRGLIQGVGVYFQEELTVIKHSCMIQGDDECRMEIKFP